MLENLNELYQEVILDHNRSPRNFSAMKDADRTAEGVNPLCGDKVKIYVKLENDVIQQISFQGSGCAISKASASMMTAALKGKTIAQVKAMFEKFHQVVTTGEHDAHELGKLAAFAGVHDYPSRVKCAILPWHAIVAALEGKKEPISTED